MVFALVKDGSDCNQHSNKTNQRMHGGDKLRHLSHLHALCEGSANGAADHDSTGNQTQNRFLGDDKGGDDGYSHPDHAVDIALTSSHWRREALQRKDEKYSRD